MKTNYILDGHIPAKPITDLRNMVFTSADKFGDKILYRYKNNEEIDTYSYNKLKDEMIYLGTAFKALNLADNGIAIIGDTHPYYTVTYIAATTAGGYIVPIDRDVSYEQTVNFIIRSEVSTIFYTKSQNQKIEKISKNLPNIRYFVAIEPEENYKFSDKVLTIAEFLKIGKTAYECGNMSYINHKIDMNKMSALLFTSGTTGTSKGVMLSHNNITASVRGASDAVAYDERHSLVSVLPPHHTYEMSCELLTTINLGCEIYINDSLKHTLKSFSTAKPNALVLVPLFVETMYKRIWDEVKKKKLTYKLKIALMANKALLSVGIDLREKIFSQVTCAFGGNLQSIVCGGAPLSAHLIEEFYSFGICIFEGYGITECSPLVAVNRPGKVKLHSVGTPVIGCQVKIDKDNPSDETGEILVKGDNVMLGYFKDQEATDAVFTEDGWFRTGDIGYMDDENFIFITGRKKNVIIMSNGKNIFPEELEEYLSKTPIILESVVVERKSETSDSTLCAIIVPNYEILENKTDEQIASDINAAVKSINKKLPSFKQMRIVEIRKEPFERTTSKKIQRFKIK